MDKSHVWSLWGCTAHMVLVAVFLLLGQHLRLEDSRTASWHMLGWLAAYKYVSLTPQVGMAFV